MTKKITKYLFTNPALPMIIDGKLQHKEGNCTLENPRKKSSCSKPKRSTIPPLITKTTGSDTHFSLISLNINGLYSLVKRHRLTDWLHKQDLTFCCLKETYLREKDRHYIRVKGWKTIFQANGLKKQAGGAILMSNKIDFQPKVIKNTRRGTSYSKSTKMNSQF